MLGNCLLGIVSVCTFISYFPQTVKLLKTKKSDDLSISSWILWVISSISYTAYAISALRSENFSQSSKFDII